MPESLPRSRAEVHGSGQLPTGADTAANRGLNGQSGAIAFGFPKEDDFAFK